MSADRDRECRELLHQGLSYEAAERFIDDRDYADWRCRISIENSRVTDETENVKGSAVARDKGETVDENTNR